MVSAWSVGSMELGMMQMNQYVAGAWSDLRVCVVRVGVVRLSDHASAAWGFQVDEGRGWWIMAGKPARSIQQVQQRQIPTYQLFCNDCSVRVCIRRQGAARCSTVDMVH